jgi:hypothetical protein
VVSGAGFGMMAPDQLAAYRAAVDDPRRGAELERIVADRRAAGLQMAGPQLRSAPRGCSRDHPRIELLRFKGLAAMRHASPAEWSALPDALALVTGVWPAAAPLDDWLATHVGPTAMVPSERPGRRPVPGRG